MIFFIKFIYTTLPSAFLLGLLKSYFNKKFKETYIVAIISFILGAFVQKLFMQALYDTKFINLLGIILLSLNVLFLLSFLLKKLNIFLYAFCSTLFLYSGALFAYYIHDLPISGANVINSDLVIHLSFIMLGIFIVIFIYESCFSLSQKFANHVFFKLSLFISVLIYSAVTLGKVLQYLVKNDLIIVTSERISFIAKLTYYSYLDVYIYIFMLLSFAFAFFLDRQKITATNLIDQRKQKKLKLVQNRWLIYGLIFSFFTLSLVFYYELVASKPPVLSPAKILNPDKNGKIILHAKDYMDGNLYRFAYITQDGHKVRFFAINRYPDKEKVVVVFDACMICGDKGYIKEDNQVICLACNVRVFVPSIGQAGGCNPIPLKYTKENGQITIDAKELEKGATYFSEIVQREVKDPISGAKLINKEAKYSYDFAGITYYFETQENLETFRDDPSKYISDIKPRWRIQGHEEP